MSDTKAILEQLAADFPDAKSELHFESPYELIVAVILSAQCTDKRVNLVTPALFKEAPTVEALAERFPASGAKRLTSFTPWDSADRR